MKIWEEFHRVMLPWLLAASVIGLLEWRHSVDAGRWLRVSTDFAVAANRQGEALDGVGKLLAAQGYTLPPLPLSQAR